MRGSMDKLMSLVAGVAVVLAGMAFIESGGNVAAGKGGPPGSACCNPDDEPGVGGNPFCYEGHSCCSDGQWRCNNPDGSPSCAPGEVCPAGCAGSHEPCDADEDCCSGVCKNNGRCA